jgi:hypothetical protein
MKRLLFTILIFVASSSISSAQEFVPWANKLFVLEDTPAIVVHDFGTVPHGTKLKYRFKVTNIYKVPLHILERPTVECGCVEPVAWSPQFQPTETGYLDLTMDASRFSGAKSVTVQVKLGDGSNFRSTALLQLKAFSRADIMLTPGQIDFGQVAVGQKLTRTLDVVYSGQAKWEVISGEANDKILDVKIEPISTSGRKPSYRVTAGVKGDVPAGVIQEQIVLKTTDQSNPFVTINVSGQVLAPFEVSPKIVKFDELEVGQVASKRVIISGNKNFKLESFSEEGITAKVQPFLNRMQVIELQFQPTAAGVIKKDITLKTDTNDKITISIEGTVKAK